MSEAGFHDADGLGAVSWRTMVVAATVAATAICLGGAVAIAALTRGVPPAISLLLMGVLVSSGAVAACGVLSRGKRRAADHGTASLLEEALTARYGVPVRRVAWHVWRINGELIEATLDPSTGHLFAGGRELSL